MATDTRNRKWFIRISKVNNTKDKGVFEYYFDEVFKTLSNKYEVVIMAIHDKDSTNIHSHIILQSDNQIRFSTLKKLLPYGDIEPQQGTNEECYNYLFHKDAKSKEQEKDEYNESCLKVKCDNIEDWLKVKEKGARTDIERFKNAILSGMTEQELLEEFPTQMARYSSFYNTCNKIRLANEFGLKLRYLYVTYIYGPAGTGKTYSVFEENGFDFNKVYSIDDYDHPFDNYNGQKVLLLDEYRGNFPVTYFLKLLDKYPLQLKARYSNKQACFDRVYIVSNIPLYKQYENVDFETRQAIMRRIHEIRHYTAFGKFETTDLLKSKFEHFTDLIPIDDDSLPF